MAIRVGIEVTINVANVVVEIDGGADPITVFIEAFGLKDSAVDELVVSCGLAERHSCMSL